MDIIASPTTVTLNTQFGAPAPGASPGEVVEAKVLQILSDTRARLAVANTVIDVTTPVPLTLGATVRLAIKNTPEGLRLMLLDPSHASSAKSAVPLGLDGGARGALAAAMPSVAAATGSAHAHSAQATPGATTETPHQPPTALNPATASTVALTTAVRAAAARQAGLGPLLSDLTAATQRPDLPQAVQTAAAAVLGLRVPTQDGITPAVLKEAFARSGLFLEVNLASAPANPLPTNDLKAALLVLRQVLRAWTGAEPAGQSPAPGLPGMPGAAGMSGLSAMSGAPGALQAATAGHPAATSIPAPPAAAPDLPPAPSLPPPYRGAPTVAQPELAPLLTDDMAADDVGLLLLRDTDAAINRQTLLQAASLPERVASSDPASGPRWHFEIPFATPQGTMLAQFEIARDGHAAPAEGRKPVWRARFSVDVEPLGAVHAQVALIGERAAVTLWAERPESAARIRANTAALTEALAEAAFEPDILVRDGAPPRPRQAAAPAGRFLDCAS